ncbi:hypothetical protein ABIE89_000522 [Bradyrhizobium niftali]|uniref:hypothetical protein n=1 Tax=Bradyrhizobium niftali TaxID=2560055 RepID=UPI0038373B31
MHVVDGQLRTTAQRVFLSWRERVFQAAWRPFPELKVSKGSAPPNLPAVGNWARLRGHEFDERCGKVLWIYKNRAGVKWIVGGDGRVLPDEPRIIHLYELEKLS